ncbi:mating-type protein A-alpha Z4-like [Homarus americanus]|uniref:mating-type protein A-alpha Z4-like n=1 Tax=Homarus americanus TaxID=6706 RepID=UPI001C4877D2|nr:mating-type protein A-alpha Z4-like [Homarus americanus]
MYRWPEGLYQSALGGDGPSHSSPTRHPSHDDHGPIPGGVGMAAAAFTSQPTPPDPDRENTDDSGMGADLEGDDRGGGLKLASDDDDDEEEEEEEEEPKTRRTSNAGNERQRRPSYTCYHGAPLPRGAAPRVARRARPRPPRNLDMFQLAAGAAVMLAPLTPELLR